MPISPIPDRGFWSDSAVPSDDEAGGSLPHVDATDASAPALEPYDRVFDQQASPPAAAGWEPAGDETAAEVMAWATAADLAGRRGPSVQTASLYEETPGMPARGVILLSSLAALGCAAIDLVLTGGLTIFFDLCFVVVCLVGAMGVRRRDLFTAGVLAPLVLAGVVAVVTLAAPETFATGGLSKVFLSGLAQHAGALVAGYSLALATVAARVSAPQPAPAP